MVGGFVYIGVCGRYRGEQLPTEPHAHVSYGDANANAAATTNRTVLRKHTLLM